MTRKKVIVVLSYEGDILDVYITSSRQKAIRHFARINNLPIKGTTTEFTFKKINAYKI